jgi:hypothetical protein
MKTVLLFIGLSVSFVLNVRLMPGRSARDRGKPAPLWLR